jgi:hypothetical protein
MVGNNPQDKGFAQARQHLEECSMCRQNFNQTKELDLIIKREMNDVPIPAYLYDMVVNRIELAARKSVARQYNNVLNQLEQIAAHSAENHQQIITAEFAETPDLNTMIICQLPSNIPQEMKIIGGGKCQLRENNVDCLFYTKDDEKISLYMMYPGDVDLEHWDGELRVLNHNDYNVAIWKDNDLIYSMVLKASVEDIMTMLNKY